MPCRSGSRVGKVLSSYPKGRWFESRCLHRFKKKCDAGVEARTVVQGRDGRDAETSTPARVPAPPVRGLRAVWGSVLGSGSFRGLQYPGCTLGRRNVVDKGKFCAMRHIISSRCPLEYPEGRDARCPHGAYL
ncbi:hypothetical protein HPB50_010372 [Hyalomma asiaticum]|uniref:Uncharacterized protein n=1 Tax=Hyalomma asiaticum TaxID=266040 RepID=A0ACB7T4L0_HYAAI|nr:hypothetical protein HPB50_010372 [Hyalomma asiaticum]